MLYVCVRKLRRIVLLFISADISARIVLLYRINASCAVSRAIRHLSSSNRQRLRNELTVDVVQNISSVTRLNLTKKNCRRKLAGVIYHSLCNLHNKDDETPAPLGKPQRVLSEQTCLHVGHSKKAFYDSTRSELVLQNWEYGFGTCRPRFQIAPSEQWYLPLGFSIHSSLTSPRCTCAWRHVTAFVVRRSGTSCAV